MLHFAVLHNLENKIACFLNLFVFFFFFFLASFFSRLFFFFLSFFNFLRRFQLSFELEESESSESLFLLVVVEEFELELELLLDDELDDPGGLGGGPGGAVIVVGLVDVLTILLLSHSLKLSSSFSGVFVVLYRVLSSQLGHLSRSSMSIGSLYSVQSLQIGLKARGVVK